MQDITEFWQALSLRSDKATPTLLSPQKSAQRVLPPRPEGAIACRTQYALPGNARFAVPRSGQLPALLIGGAAGGSLRGKVRFHNRERYYETADPAVPKRH